MGNERKENPRVGAQGEKAEANSNLFSKYINDTTPGRLPLVEGYMCGGDVIVSTCPICGDWHKHGFHGKVGDTIVRVHDLKGYSDYTGKYVIRVVDEVDEGIYQKCRKTHPCRLFMREPEYIGFPLPKEGETSTNIPFPTKIYIVWCEDCLKCKNGDIFEVLDCRRGWCQNIDDRYEFKGAPHYD